MLIGIAWGPAALPDWSPETWTGFGVVALALVLVITARIGHRRSLVLIVAAVAGASVGFLAVGRFARRAGTGDFDWELASTFGTAAGTVLLASATALLAVITRRITQEQLDIAARPLLIDLGSSRKPGPIETRYFPDRAGGGYVQVDVPAETIFVGEHEMGPGTVVLVSVPVRNAAKGAAIISGAPRLRVRGSEAEWTEGEALDRVLPFGESTLLRWVFHAVLENGVVYQTFEAEIDYTDVGERQRMRSCFWISLKDVGMAPSAWNVWETTGLEFEVNGRRLGRAGGAGRDFFTGLLPWTDQREDSDGAAASERH